MKLPLIGLLAVSLLVPNGSAGAQERTYTIDTVLSLEQLGRSSFDPTGRFVVFERYGPYGSSQAFDHGWYTRFTRSDLFIHDRDAADSARRLLPPSEGTGHVLGAWSPNGRRLLVFRFRDRTWRAGIYTLASGEIAWLAVTPELPIYGPIAAWRGDDELILATRADGDLPWHLRLDWEPNTLRSHLADQQSAGQESAIVIGSGASRNFTPLSPMGRLLRVDADTLEVRDLGAGRFQDVELSPDGRFVAAADEGGVLPVDPNEPMIQGELQRARGLRIFDLETGSDWTPHPGWDLLPNLLTWSQTGELLVWLRPPGGAWSDGSLKRIAADRQISATVALGDLRPTFRQTSEALPVVLADWMGTDPVLSAQRKGRTDWYRLSPGQPVTLTEDFATAPARLVVTGSGVGLALDAGVVWRIEPDGRRRPLSDAGANLAHVPSGSGLFGLRPQFNTTDRIPGIPVLSADGTIYEARPDGLSPVMEDAHASVRAPSPSGFLETLRTAHGVETLVRRAVGTRVALASINPQLADVEVAEVLPVAHLASGGQTLTSWLYLPPRPTTQALPALVVIPYPGLVHARRPDLAEPYAVMTAYNVQVLTSAGYAVLLPSLPRQNDGEPGAGIAHQIEGVVDEAAKTGRFDPDRIALLGHSFGGFGVIAAATQSGRFDGMIAANGAYEHASKWGSFIPFKALSPRDVLSVFSSAGRVETGQGALFGPPWEDPERYVRNSPYFDADCISAPVLIISTELDYVPITQSQMLFSALYRQNKDAQLITYINEGHVVTSPANVRHMHDQILAFLARIFDPDREPPHKGAGAACDQPRTQASVAVSNITSP